MCQYPAARFSVENTVFGLAYQEYLLHEAMEKHPFFTEFYCLWSTQNL